MAINYEEARLRLMEALPSGCPNNQHDAGQLIEMLRDEKPLNQLYDFIKEKTQGEHRDNLKALVKQYWSIIQKHRNKNKMEKEFVNLNAVYDVVNEILDEEKAKQVLSKLIPLTTRLKPCNPKRVDMLVKVLKGMNFRQKYHVTLLDQDIARDIDERGVQAAISSLLKAQVDEKVIADIEEEICKQMKRDLLPISQKKTRTDPLANVISQLDFYHNYGIEIRTDEITKEMHQRGIRKVLKELLLEHFGWKEIERVETEINAALAPTGTNIVEHDQKNAKEHKVRDRYELSP